MSFDAWKFTYTPPKTVVAPVLNTSTSVLDTSTISGVSTASQSNASKLIAKLEDLKATAQYLQEVVLARSKGISITVDPATDPDVARALEVLYGVGEAPSVITVDMYDRTLEAEMTALQTEMSLASDSPYEVNPFQVAAATTVSQTVEDALVATGEFQHTIPLLLRNLKGDEVVYSSLQSSLAEYPACEAETPLLTNVDITVTLQTNGTTGVILSKAVDVSAGLYGTLDSYMNSMQTVYASVYKVTAMVSDVEKKAEDLLTAYVTQPIEDIIRIISIFQTLKGMMHIPKMSTLIKGLTGFVFVRLLAEAAHLRMYVDRFMQIAIEPMKSIMGTVGRALSELQSVAKHFEALHNTVKGAFTKQSGSLKGMSSSYSCGMPHNAAAPKPLKGISGLDSAGKAVNKATAKLSSAQQAPGKDFTKATSAAITSMASHLQWGMDSSQDKADTSDEACKKLAARRVQDQKDMLDLMCSLQAMDTMSNMAKAVISSVQSGSNTKVTTAQQVLAVGAILASTGTGNGTAFAVQNGQITMTPPDVPIPPAPVQTVLQSGGIQVVFTDDPQSLVNGVPA